ncbi:hypothetical protein HBI49_056270 [Parastagonospora nodorum]|nr:hypothetical protein HBH42_005020 [Parastagonospora nodorum]KAH5373674.1 hypothetical protein HBI48_020300 [Parastagonospora nodorum]KAH5374432.1 hypothetical protein HBI49_056270 [Parastagonospora nodorum]KAH5530257.1 hypothetical protein HBI52_019990 [Parastagonospora nodorum]KAH5820215.1 hypothetical protein HBI94_101580 [Parastagonospora nodorum]
MTISAHQKCARISIRHAAFVNSSEIVKDFGYPIDQLIYQYCRDVGDNDPDCRTCATTGCVCAADCLRAVFQCADDKGWYSYTGSCPHNRCAVGECL